MSKQKLEIDIATTRQLNAADLGYLLLWCERQINLEQSLGFAKWLHDTVGDLVVRRADPMFEPTMISVPNDWDSQTISDALIGSYVLTRHPCTEAVAKLADELHLRCLVYASSVLSELRLSYR